jgi:hypothetical protein
MARRVLTLVLLCFVHGLWSAELQARFTERSVQTSPDSESESGVPEGRLTAFVLNNSNAYPGVHYRG